MILKANMACGIRLLTQISRLSNGFLNKIYRFISGEDLTLFDAICLLIAIPSTIIIKLVTGQKPPTFENMNKQFFHSRDAAESSDNASSTTALSKQSQKDFNTMMLGCGCGAAVIALIVKNIKFLYKTATGGGLVVGVGSLSPSAIMELFGMVIDGIAIFEELSNPPEAGAPGAGLRKAALYVKCFRLACNGIYMVAQKLGMENPVADQVMLCIDVLTVLTNFGLYSAVYIQELDDPKWKDYDEELTLANGADNFLEAIAGIGYFVSFTFKDKEPNMTLVGLGCMQVAGYGAIVTKGVHFGLQYKKP